MDIWQEDAESPAFTEAECDRLIALKRRLMSAGRIPRPTSMVTPPIPMRSPWVVPQPKEERE